MSVKVNESIEDTVSRVIDEKFRDVLGDISWRMGQLRELEQSVTSGVARRVVAEDMNTLDHQLTGYTISDNSPSNGSIAWADLHMVYAGNKYAIADGNTAQHYVWWDHTQTGSLKSSNTKPALSRGDALVFLNAGGNAVVALSDMNQSMPNALADDAVDKGSIISRAVDSDALADNSLIDRVFDNNSVPGRAVQNDAIDTPQIAGGAVDHPQLAGNAVDSNNLRNDSVQNASIANDAVDKPQIKGGAVGSSEIGNGAVGNPALANNAVDTPNIRDGAVDTNQIAGNAVTEAKTNFATDFSNAISAAQSDATQALNIANNAIETYYTSNPPWPNGSNQPDSSLGDLWYDSDTDQVSRWNGSQWKLITNEAVSNAIAAAQAAQATADSKITTYFQDSPPSANRTNPAPAEGDIWVDTNNDNLVHVWDSGAWAGPRRHECHPRQSDQAGEDRRQGGRQRPSRQ